MKLKQFVIFGAVAAAMLAAPVAHAAFIIGSASVAGFFEDNTTALGVPTSIVSQLTVFDVQSAVLVGSTSGSLVPDISGTAFDFTTTLVPQTMYAFNGFTFVVSDFDVVSAQTLNCTTRQCVDSIAFNADGIVTGNGFQATGFTLTFSANGSCNESTTTPGQCGGPATASYSASLSATGSEPGRTLPEPATLALVGLALVGVGLSSRRRA